MTQSRRDRWGRRRPSPRLVRCALSLTLLAALVSVASDTAVVGAQARYSTEACQFNGAGQFTSLQVGVAGSAKPDPLNQFPNTVTLSAVFVAAPILADFGLIGYNFGFLNVGTNQVPITASLTITASNTVEGSQTFTNVNVLATTVITDPDGVRLTGDETATPLPITFALTNSTWTATGAGDLAFANTGSTTTVTLGSFVSTIDCQPGVPSSCGTNNTNCVSFTPEPAVPFALLPGDGLRLQHQAPIVALAPVSLSSGAVVATGTLPALIIDNDGSNSVGWTLSAYVTDFLRTGAPDCSVPQADCIPADNLGWRPVLPAEYRAPSPGSSGVTAGTAMATSAADWLAQLQAAGPAGVNGLGGLGEVNVLCMAPPGAPSATVGCGAELYLGIPASAASGSYSGVLVLTIT